MLLKLVAATGCLMLLLSVSADAHTHKNTQEEELSARSLPLVGPQGIVVPKRSALIIGLNQQFKFLHGGNNQQPNTNSSSTTTLTSPQPAASSVFNKSPSLLELSGFHWLGSRVSQDAGGVIGQVKPLKVGVSSGYAQKQQLYLDRHQQQILAANPNLLNPSNLPNSLLTRSELVSSQVADNQSLTTSGNVKAPNGTTATTLNGGGFTQQLAAQSKLAEQPILPAQNSALPVNQQLQQQQLYRGFSLIELEVKTERDRRYIQDLYGNLSAVINEQANNPAAGSLSVSPYVDVDFWSFKYALNDQIDIMVSPKARSFILGQLNRAKIRHRIKIDDMQTRLDQQQQQLQPLNPAQLTFAASGSLQKQEVTASESQLSGRVGGGGSSSGQAHHQEPIKAQFAQSSLNARQAAGQQQQQNGGPQEVAARPLNDSQFFENYQRLADINQYVESLVEKNREIARVKVIGRSSQGRYLRVLKLGYELPNTAGEFNSPQSEPAYYEPSSNTVRQLNNASVILENFFKKQQTTKRLGSIWLDGGTHAREWISPSTVLYIAHRLSDNHNKCQKFYDQLREAVASETGALLELEQQRSARQQRFNGQPLIVPTHLEADLLSGINEINTSLLGKPAKPIRARTELEQTLELLAKNPQEVASEYACDLQLEQLLRRYTFYMMPVLNPDGYEYSHTHNRLWRKTRSTSNHPIYRHFCLGADPNRNYDARHGNTGSSTHPCSQTYAGTVPFTEPETRHQSNFVYANRADMKMFISFHSYSQMILLPFSHSRQLAPDHKDLESVGLAAVKAIEQTHGTVYKVGPSASILYTASGTASDWAYEKAGIKYSYTIELRDTGTFGFLLPRQQIVPTGEETFNGLLAMIQQMEKNDNLLTSKSSLLVAPSGGAQLSAPTNASAVPASQVDHSLDLDSLKPLSKQGFRMGLENVHEGSSTWNSLDSGPTGVRDRRPQPQSKEPIGSLTLPENDIDRGHQHIGLQPSEGANAGSRYESLSGEPLIGHKPNPVNENKRNPDQYPMAFAGDDNNLQEPSDVDSESAPDSGYAFEGEGELMEPTRENIIDATKLNAELKSLTGRNDHSKRISQSVGLTPSGRNFINSPLLKSRIELPAFPKRESSNNIASDGN